MQTIKNPRSMPLAYLYHITMTAMLFFAIMLTFERMATATCTTDLADIPLATVQQPAPPLIMFLIDDSGSMDWEVLTNESDGTFGGDYYVFDDPGDNAYYGSVISGQDRAKWQSQWAGYNFIYYDPTVTYTPWPNWTSVPNITVPGSAPNADPDNPPSNPLNSQYNTLNLDNTYYSLGDVGTIIENKTQGVVVVDDTETGGFSHTGPWTQDKGWNAPYDASQNYNKEFYYTSDAQECTATWTATNLDSTKTYDVYALYYGDETFSSQVPYTISASGTRIDGKTIDQSSNTEQWVQINTTPLTFSGGQGSVSIDVTPQWVQGRRRYLGNLACADAVAFVPHGLAVTIVNSHYYVQNSNGTFLVNIVGSGGTGEIDYYQFNDTNSNNVVDAGELTPLTPSQAQADGIVTGRTYAQERQNFANYYSFYRKHISTLKSAIGQAIAGLSGVEVGFYTINHTLEQPVLPVGVSINNQPYDQSQTLLNALYSSQIQEYSTPLRQGLVDVGNYFKGTTINNNGSFTVSQSSSTTAGFTSTGTSGTYPYFTSAYGGSCQQAFCIVATDGFYNGSLSSSVGNIDGGSSPLCSYCTDNNCVGNVSSCPNNCSSADCSKFSDTISDALADIAMEYYATDLQPNLANSVPINAYDDNNAQHMVTYALSFALTGTLGSPTSPTNSSYASCPLGNCPTWPSGWDPNDTSSQPEKLDDLWHAAVDGHGMYLSAKNGNAVVQAVQTIIQNITARTGSASSLATNSIQRQAGAVIYQGVYHTNNWYGDILAQNVDPSTGSITGSAWKDASGNDATANTFLNAVAATNRIIFTDYGGAGEPFRYNSLNAAQQTELSSDTTTASELVDYLRGDPTNNAANGGTFRTLSAKIGDVVHSAPTYYNNVIYIGTNDGMMHAFGASSGKELFAYVPNIVFPNLKNLASLTYAHQYYVDNTPYVRTIPTSTTSPPTTEDLLVGGLGKGGKGYYCLNVTGVKDGTSTTSSTPANETAAAGMFMWEYSAGANNDTDMGYSYSQAYIVDTHAGWAVIFGNGYSSSSGKAVLYVLNATTGSVIAKIPATSGGDCNGLSTPAAVDVDGDGIVDYVYAGDLKGNLWKFDLTSTSAANWNVAYQATDGTPEPLFQAKNASGQTQPITTAPDVMSQCNIGLGGYIVVFGTGQYLGTSDLQNTNVQTLYGIWDWADTWAKKTGGSAKTYYLGSFTNSSPRTLSHIAGNTALTTNAQKVTLLQQTVSYQSGVWGSMSNNAIDYYNPSTDSGHYAGWYFDLPASGERLIDDPVIQNGVAIFISSIPASSPCTAGGSSVIYQLNACSGGWNQQSQFVSNPTIGNNLQVSFETVSQMLFAPMIWGNQIYVNDAFGNIHTFQVPPVTSGLYFWRKVGGSGF